MGLEFEPLPPEPPPLDGAARPPLRGSQLRGTARIQARRAFFGYRVSFRPGSAASVARSVLASILAHAALFGLLWAIWLLRPSPMVEREVTYRISLTQFVEAADPEAEAGGTSPTAEAPQDGDQAAKGDTPGLLLDESLDATTVGAGAAPAGSVFLGRTGGKERLLEAGGGDAASEGALRMALAWLARHQNDDGTWSAVAFGRRCTGPVCDGVGEADYAEAATALALLPLLGAGHSHRDGPWKDTVRRGLVALVAKQRADGSFGGDEKRGYSTAIAALALADAYGLTAAPSLRGPAQRAVDHLVRTQSRNGGWRYFPGDGANDSSVTGWATTALCVARKSGLDVPPETLDACRAWFAGVRSDEGEFGYVARGGGSASLLGVGAFTDILLGADPASPRLAPTIDRLERRLPRPARDENDNAAEYGVADPIHWYYGALATFQRGGGTWRVWNERLRESVLSTQVHDATDARGSWPPMGATGRHGGRVVTTALCAMSLEVYYRYPRATLR
ncbi:MAG: hypothetical protein K8T90_11150 [Planctomycetes bacterium]|nr:hypothetical protein [Planctomycetota bacterium]